jgi:hypothetical protein
MPINESESKTMNRTLLAIALIAAGACAEAASYTYQGSLEDAGKPAEGLYDVQLRVTDGSQRPLAATVTLYGVKVSKGQFSTAVDFGVDLSQHGDLQLHAAVRQGSGDFVAIDQPAAVNLKSTQGAVCWEVGGNSGVASGAILGTNSAADSAITSLRSRGDDILYVRGTTGGVEQNNSAANGTGAAAWNDSSAAGANSFTAVNGRTGVNASNSVVFADGSNGLFTSNTPNQFLVRADGGVMVNTNATPTVNDDFTIGTRPTTGDPDADLVLRTRSGKFGRLYVRDLDNAFFMSVIPTGANFLETTANGARLTAGGTWTNGSSRLFKQGFAAIDVGDVLNKVVSMPITRWTYRNSSEGAHIGPMAEDFQAAFDLGSDNQHIATVDADGVALAAIQGLNEKLEAENAGLKARLAAIEAQLGL